MPDKSTIEGCRSIADGRLPGLPSFVRQLCEPDGLNPADCFDHWAPRTITGYAPLDHALGRQHCLEALAYSRQIGTANFLLYVVMAMLGRPIGDIERGFIAELVSPALAGRIPPFVPNEVMQEIACDGADVDALRVRERFMATSIDACRNNPGPFYNYVVDLVSGGQGQWIGAAIYLLVGAALNGSLH